MGNGNLQSLDPFQADFANLFYGKAMAIVRSGLSKGEIEINARSKGIPGKKITLDME